MERRGRKGVKDGAEKIEVACECLCDHDVSAALSFMPESWLVFSHFVCQKTLLPIHMNLHLYIYMTVTI